jgi:hypothetical protein
MMIHFPSVLATNISSTGFCKFVFRIKCPRTIICGFVVIDRTGVSSAANTKPTTNFLLCGVFYGTVSVWTGDEQPFAWEHFINF